MAREIINVGAAPNDGQGNPIRTAFIKTNNNFGELYSRSQPVPPVALTGSVGDAAGMTAYDAEYYYYCFANYDGSSDIWNQVPNAAQANVTTLLATGNITANGNITADYYFGDGGQLSNVIAGPGTTLINGNTNIVLASNGNANITINGTSNVAVFTTTGVAISGNVTAGTLSTTGNVTAGNLRTTGAVSATGIIYSTTGLQTAGASTATGNVTGGNVLTAGVVSATGNVTTGGRISSVGNINTSANVIAVGNVTGNYIIGDGGFLSNVTVVSNVAVTQIANGTSSLAVTGSAGNIVVAVNGVSNVAQFVPNGIEVLGNVNSANIYLTGRFVSVGNVTGSNLLATSGVIATGNVTGAHVNSDLTMSATGNIQGGNLRTAGNVSASGTVTGITFNGNVLATTVSASGTVTGITFNGNVAATTVSASGTVTGVTFNGNVLATTVSASGTVTGGNVNTAGVVSAAGNITGSYFFGNGSQLTSVVANSVGTLTSLSVTGNTTTGNLLTGGAVSATGNVIGSYFVGTATSAQYADIAENYTADAEYESGTVLEFGGAKEVTIAADETARVAGIVSTTPAHLMNSMLNSEHVVAVALLGRVPCRVRGNVAKGDMLISAGNGYARAKQNPMPGTVIGKALEASTGDHGIIEVVVGRL